MIFSEILKLENGARFWNVDLHIHSYGASADVKDVAMTPQAIVDSAIKQGLSVIAITDHNSDANVAAGVAYAQSQPGKILVLPGVEVTTAHGHLLAYFSPDEINNLSRFLAKIDLVGAMGAANTHTAKSMADVIAEAEKLGGICIAAHIDRTKTGFEMFAPGFQNWKRDIICSSGLYGIECDAVDSLKWYSDADDAMPDGPERKNIYKAREEVPGLKGREHLAYVQGSDSHSLADFEKPRSDKLWTRMKLTELTWEAVKTAFVDPSARVRAKASLPKAIPRVRGIVITGGFLHGETIHFSDNLNCFIGGRGTGKSTAIRALAYTFGLNDEFCEFGNCPDSTLVYCEDANGVHYCYERSKGGDITVDANEDRSINDAPIDSFRIEYFGQGALAEVAKDPLNTPQLLQQFLDRHIDLKDLIETGKLLVSQLRENAGRLDPLEGDCGQLGDKREKLAGIEKKLEIAEEGKLRDIVGIQSKIASEKTILTTVEQIVQEYTAGLTSSNFEHDFEQLANGVGAVTGDEKSESALQHIRETLNNANVDLRERTIEINAALKITATELEKDCVALKANHTRMSGEIAIKVADLKTKGLAGSIAELEQLLRQKSAIGKEISTIERCATELQKCRDRRDDLRKQLAETRIEMTGRRKAQLKQINQNLSISIPDYKIFIRYDNSGITDEFCKFVQNKMTGTYFQDHAVRQLCEKVTPSDFADWVLQRDFKKIVETTGLSAEWAQQIVGKLCYWNILFDLQVLAKQPKPIITVHTKGAVVQEIPIVQLSDGQRHTILLTIALLAESNIPLVIDQPEDDLDNAFIFSSIVTTLRAIKERRQVILITHNANIAVLGDSELLLPMHRENDCGKAKERGSIDRTDTKKRVLEILEGGHAAFARRRQIYSH